MGRLDEFIKRRCESTHMTAGVRCEKQTGHPGYHWHVGVNGTHVWGLPLRTTPLPRRQPTTTRENHR